MSLASGSDRAGDHVHHERVTLAANGQGFAKASAFALGAGKSVVDVDNVGIHAGGRGSVPLGSEILSAGGDSDRDFQR
ncbi:hypothetical protein QFZ35_003318 [Arthrobacter ulcerisalmonis]|nr:hypothetical protein [Arthrobacter ulcerisalmonis]